MDVVNFVYGLIHADCIEIEDFGEDECIMKINHEIYLVERYKGMRTKIAFEELTKKFPEYKFKLNYRRNMIECGLRSTMIEVSSYNEKGEKYALKTIDVAGVVNVIVVDNLESLIKEMTTIHEKFTQLSLEVDASIKQMHMDMVK